MQGDQRCRIALSRRSAEPAEARTGGAAQRDACRDGGVSFARQSGLFGARMMLCKPGGVQGLRPSVTEVVMRYAMVAVCAGTLIATIALPPLSAQSTPKRSADEIRALHDAHKGDFDSLFGDWEFPAE